jgi:fluoroquinolone resistance protein
MIRVEDQTFKALTNLTKAEYENCHFIQCGFNELNLNNYSFSECIFEACDLSNVKIANTSFKDVQFRQCKLLGLKFEEVNPFLFSVLFESCSLNFASFYKVILKATNFSNCSLQEVDFSGTDLTDSTFDNCDFSASIFDGSLLKNVNFRTSYNFSIDPSRNQLTKAKFSKENCLGLLNHLKIEIK